MAKKSKIRRVSKKSGKKKNVSRIIIIVSIIVVLAVLAVLAFKLDWIKITGDAVNEEVEEIKELKEGFAAKVNDDVIDYQTLDKQYELFFTITSYPEQYKETLLTKEKYLSQLIVESLLTQEAEKQGMMLSDVKGDEVKEILDLYLSQLEYTEEEFVMVLVDKGLTIDEVVEYFKRQIVMMEFLNNTVLADVSVSEEEIKAYYDANIEDFTAPEGQIRARHILVDTEEEADEIVALLDKGGDFAELAEERSTDGSAERGGDLGFFGKEQMIEVFSDSAFALEEEEISQPVESMYGFHIIKRETDVISLEETREAIDMVLFGNKQRTELQMYLEELKLQYNITIS